MAAVLLDQHKLVPRQSFNNNEHIFTSWSSVNIRYFLFFMLKKLAV